MKHEMKTYAGYQKKTFVKRVLSLTLAITLFVTWEIPALAESVTDLHICRQTEALAEESMKEAAETEAAIFAEKEGVILSGNGMETTGNGVVDSIEPEIKVDISDTDALRQPDISYEDNPDVFYGEPVDIGKNYRTYRLPDGTYKTIFTTYENTFEKNGVEQVIDNTLIETIDATGEAYTNKANLVDITLPAGSNEETQMTVATEEIEAVMTPVDGNYGKESVSENAIRYNDVYENIDIQYTIQPNGMKQDIILTAPQEKHTFTYRLDKDGVVAVETEGVIYLYEAAQTDAFSVSNNGIVSANTIPEGTMPKLMISAPCMVDAAGASSDSVNLSLKEEADAYLITLTADKEWLMDEERIYPIKIDPTTNLPASGKITNYTISSGRNAMGGEQVSHAGFFSDIGKARSYTITDLFYESLAFPYEKGVDVISAKFNIYQLNDATGFTLGCYRLETALPSQNQTWGAAVAINRHIAGENCISNAKSGWHTFDVRDSVSGWIRSIYKCHGLVIIASDEESTGAMFATENYGDASKTPTLEIIWEPAGDVYLDYPLSNTTVNLRPMMLTTTAGKMQCYGVFADGIATPGSILSYELSDTSKGYAGVLAVSNEKIYPDSTSFQSVFPTGTLKYKDAKSNWQTINPFTEFEYNTVYTIRARARKDSQAGNLATSDEFLIYRITRYDTMTKIADYYGVPLSTLLFDNKAADALLVENNTLFIRNPQRNKNTPYQPADLTDAEKAKIDSALLGRALHCEYGFEPINLNTGNFYLSQEDFAYTDALGTFALQRSYNSKNAGRLGLFGRGFTGFLDESIGKLADGTLVYNREDGSSLYFAPGENGTYVTPEGYQLTLTAVKTGTASAEFSNGTQSYPIYRYDIQREDHSTVSFDAKGNLIQLKAENGAITTINRNSKGTITGITREGITMAVTMNADGRIASVTMPTGGVYTYSYDSHHNLVRVTDPLGNYKRFVYDGNHRMMSWYDEKGTRIVENTYDSEGRVIRQLNETGGTITLVYEEGKTTTTDAEDNTTVYEFDDAYRTTAIYYPDGTTETKAYTGNLLTSETDRSGVVTNFTYDEKGNITKKSVNGITTTFAYNEAGKLIETISPLGNVTTASYDNKGNLLSVTEGAVTDNSEIAEANTSTTTYTYDSRSRLLTETDGNGTVTSYTYQGNYPVETKVDGKTIQKVTYDACGNIKTLTDGNGNTTTYNYDKKGQLLFVAYPEGGSITYSYDKKGLVKTATDAYGNTTTYTYNGQSDITSVTDSLGNTYHYTYDQNGNRLSETDPKGNVTAYRYDSMNRLIETTDALGNTTTYTYNGMDEITSVVDPKGHTITIEYDPVFMVPVKEVDAKGAETLYTYDNEGNLTSVTKDGITQASYMYDSKGQLTSATYANGLAETYGYDNAGNAISMTDSQGRVTVNTYDNRGNLITATTADNATTTYGYDLAGNLITITDPEGNETTFTYDGNGNLLSETDGEGNTTTYRYDLNNRLTQTTFADGTGETYIYDSEGRMTGFADGRKYLTTYRYDQNGNLILITDPLGNATEVTFDALNHMERIKDANGNTTTYGYDGLGNVTSETDVSGNSISYTYDPNGNLTSLTDKNGNETTYDYDSFNRLIKETDALGNSTSYGYDVMGNLTSQTDAKGVTTTYTYDLYGNLLTETNGKGHKTEYTYSTGNRLTVVKDACGGSTTLSYDKNGNVTEITDPKGNITAYTYDKAGRMMTETAPDGGEKSFTYDPVGRVLTETDALGRSLSYGYDAKGNLTTQTDADGNSTTYSYDPNGNLTKITHPNGDKELFAYDAVGNLTHEKQGEENLTEYSYDFLNRLSTLTDALGNTTTYSYDKNGNLIRELAPDNSATTYSYDSLNRLTKQTLPNDGSYSYNYDCVGNLTKTTGPTGITASYGYDSLGNVVKTMDGEGNTTAYGYDSLSRVITITDALGGKTAYSYDKNSNVTAITYADGSTYRYSYDNNDRLLTTTDPAGLQSQNRYDKAGQLLAVTEGNTALSESRTTRYSYDTRGNVTAVTNALGGIATREYDTRNRVTKTISPKGSETTVTYDALSNVKAQTNALGYTTSYGYDAKGRLISEDIAGLEEYQYRYDSRDRLVSVEGENSLVTYTYNSVGNLTSVTNGTGAKTTYDYDKAGNLTKETDALLQTQTFAYNKNGSLMESTDENGVTTRYDYDALNRLVKKDTGETLSSATYGYDSMGRLIEMSDVTGESVYTYDSAGRLITATDGNGKKLTYGYDIYGNVTSVTYPDGKSVTYTFDALDRMTSVTDLEGKTTRYEYDADGNLTKVIRSDGETRLFYDALGQVTGIGNVKDGETISAYAYRYDGRGNIIYEEAVILVEGKLVKTISTYSYDGKSQLVESHVQTPGEAEAVTTYVYDPAGNRLEMETVKGSETLTVSYRYDEAGRLVEENDSQNGITTYTYDKAGNLVETVTNKADGSNAQTDAHTVTEPVERHYIYDASDRLTAVTDKDTLLLAALYDGNDNRIFTMEYAPELQRTAGSSGSNTEDAEGGRNRSGIKASDSLSDNTVSADTLPDTEGQSGDTDGKDTTGGNGGSGSGRFAKGAKAFWYGVFCQTADLFLPAPTPFKAWLHDKMGFTDDLDVLFTEEVYEVTLAENNLTVNEAGSPFALLQNVFAKTNQQSIAADAYRQVSYLNDTTYDNTQVLMEYAVNGSLGSTTTAYSFGVRRESFVETTAGMGAGATMGGMTYQSSGTYYYTGTGSVANVTGSATNQSYSYTASGSMTAFAMSASATGASDSGITGTSTLKTNPTAYGTYGVYGYNGEYTHTSLGLQYLRARYLNVATGTFTSKDTYAGRMQDILSQNRYTYAENNPVGRSDPSGHAVKSGISSILKKAANTIKAAVTGQSSGNVKKRNTPTSNIAAAYKSSSLNYVRAQAQLNASLAKAEKSRAKAELIEKPLEWYQSASAWVDKGLVKVAGYLDSSWSGPCAEAFATKVKDLECDAYEYCINKEQTVIKERLKKGTGLFGKGVLEAFAGAAFTVTGLIYPASFIPGAFELTAAVSDISQGVQELEYGWNGDATSESVNFFQDTVFLGEEEIYEMTTDVVGSLGLFLFAGAGGAYKVTPVQNASTLRSSAVPITLGGKAATQTMGTTALTVQLTTQQPAQVTTPVVNNQQILMEESGSSSEVFYRTMSQADYDYLRMTGELPATSETFISPTYTFSSNYDGVIVKFELRNGTTNSLLEIGVGNNADQAIRDYGVLPQVSKGWTENNAFFKGEGTQTNIGLGQGKALEIFNSNIINFTQVGGK